MTKRIRYFAEIGERAVRKESASSSGSQPVVIPTGGQRGVCKGLRQPFSNPTGRLWAIRCDLHSYFSDTSSFVRFL